MPSGQSEDLEAGGCWCLLSSYYVSGRRQLPSWVHAVSLINDDPVISVSALIPRLSTRKLKLKDVKYISQDRFR